MEKERFTSGYGLISLALVCLSVMFVASYYDGKLFLNQSGLTAGAIALAGLLLVAWTQKTIYLEIQNSRTLINSGYYDFKKDTLDIHDIKYIYRVPQFIIRYFGGSLMVIYIKDDNGGIRHSPLRERNYPEATLKKFLLRIKALKPTIELDPEYEAFLADKIDLHSASQNSVEGVEQRLRDKGETWNRVTGAKKFLSKL